MNLLFTIFLFLAYTIEPIMWGWSMSKVKWKYSSTIIPKLAVFFYFLFGVAKQMISTFSIGGKTLDTFLIFFLQCIYPLLLYFS